MIFLKIIFLFVQNKIISKPYNKGDFIFNVPDTKYLEIVPYAIAMNNILGKDFANAFFDKKDYFINNFGKFFDSIQSNYLKDFCSNYNVFCQELFVRPDKYLLIILKQII